jgi:AraC-like DNA-binding protein
MGAGTQWQDGGASSRQDELEVHMAHARLPVRGPSARDFDRRVREVVAAQLAGGPLHVRVVADSVNTSARTLQRRLHRAGLTYARVVQQVRFEVAKQMLRDPSLRIGDVARTLGYSHPAHFTRAFQRWTGVTPREFRRQRLDDARHRSSSRNAPD